MDNNFEPAVNMAQLYEMRRQFDDKLIWWDYLSGYRKDAVLDRKDENLAHKMFLKPSFIPF
mgnify:CR=1 FL=1